MANVEFQWFVTDETFAAVTVINGEPIYSDRIPHDDPDFETKALESLQNKLAEIE